MSNWVVGKMARDFVLLVEFPLMQAKPEDSAEQVVIFTHSDFLRFDFLLISFRRCFGSDLSMCNCWCCRASPWDLQQSSFVGLCFMLVDYSFGDGAFDDAGGVSTVTPAGL